jgi:hypothetical protein
MATKIKGLDISDLDLIRAEHGGVDGAGRDDDVLWTVVFRAKKKRGQPEELLPMNLHIAPRFDARSLAREYGYRSLNGSTVVSMEAYS